MTRLIDADALISSVLKKAIDDAFLNGNTDMHRLLIQVIAHQPTIDAVPVIRCANCKYYSTETEQTSMPNMRRCTWWRNIGTFPIDFCSRAEPKSAND